MVVRTVYINRYCFGVDDDLNIIKTGTVPMYYGGEFEIEWEDINEESKNTLPLYLYDGPMRPDVFNLFDILKMAAVPMFIHRDERGVTRRFCTHCYCAIAIEAQVCPRCGVPIDGLTKLRINDHINKVISAGSAPTFRVLPYGAMKEIQTTVTACHTISQLKSFELAMNDNVSHNISPNMTVKLKEECNRMFEPTNSQKRWRFRGISNTQHVRDKYNIDEPCLFPTHVTRISPGLIKFMLEYDEFIYQSFRDGVTPELDPENTKRLRTTYVRNHRDLFDIANKIFTAKRPLNKDDSELLFGVVPMLVEASVIEVAYDGKLRFVGDNLMRVSGEEFIKKAALAMDDSIYIMNEVFHSMKGVPNGR